MILKAEQSEIQRLLEDRQNISVNAGQSDEKCEKKERRSCASALGPPLPDRSFGRRLIGDSCAPPAKSRPSRARRRYSPTPCSSSLDVRPAPSHVSGSTSHPHVHTRLLAVRVPPAAEADPPSSSFSFDRFRTCSDFSCVPADEARRQRTRPTELVFPMPSTHATGAPTPTRAGTSSGGVGRQRSKLTRASSSVAPHGPRALGLHSDARDAAEDSDSSASAKWVRVQNPALHFSSWPPSTPSNSTSSNYTSAPPAKRTDMVHTSLLHPDFIIPAHPRTAPHTNQRRRLHHRQQNRSHQCDTTAAHPCTGCLTPYSLAPLSSSSTSPLSAPASAGCDWVQIRG
ncbi:hypothetical protein C8R44DRAFT_871620 [Mycena epipterygia]|nr:hypothetical protein C8R44DRAFT_871620 [Mycena epipterygia]